MRLINTSSMRLGVFYDSGIPVYAILSHRWEREELDLQGFEALNLMERRNVPKIGRFCSMAAADGYEWAWSDTCCIDKKSSAELTEGINSMYRWYKGADRCYAYINDVTWPPDVKYAPHAIFRASQWFTRGWTLQELLAPDSVQFYDKNWNYFGDKETLSHDICKTTGIAKQYLTDPAGASAAMKLSWMSKRETSRKEDMAYCLIGLFDISMSMRYGEGNHAFRRLQLEIIKNSDDESIFAWIDRKCKVPHGMLASSPKAFARSHDIVRASGGAMPRLPYSMTNKGLEMRVGLPGFNRCGVLHEHQTLIFGLNCERQSDPEGSGKAIAIELHKFDDYWQRVNCNEDFPRKNVIETTFKDGARCWPASDLTETTAVYIKQEDS